MCVKIRVKISEFEEEVNFAPTRESGKRKTFLVKNAKKKMEFLLSTGYNAELSGMCCRSEEQQYIIYKSQN